MSPCSLVLAVSNGNRSEIENAPPYINQNMTVISYIQYKEIVKQL